MIAIESHCFYISNNSKIMGLIGIAFQLHYLVGHHNTHLDALRSLFYIADLSKFRPVYAPKDFLEVGLVLLV